MTVDTKEICRLCGKWGGLTLVFDEDDLWLKIFMCFGVKIQKEDHITQKICKSCYFFTNSVYEFRLSSIEHDTELRKAYQADHSNDLEEIIEDKTAITYPSEETSLITQESFLNTFNLENKYHHPSVLKLKRKYPFVSIPKEWCELNIDPVVYLNRESDNKKVKQSEDLGIWSVRNKLSTGKHQPDLVLTRVRSNDTSSNSDVSDNNKSQNENKVSPRRRRKGQWQKRKIKARTVKKVLQRTHEDNDDFVYESNNPSESDTMSISSTVEQDRNVLKNLLHTDAHLNDSLPQCSSDYIEPRIDDYSNLLVTVGEEVKTYICQTCNKIFDTQFALTHHKKFSHKSSLQCTKCSQRFNIVESLVKHNHICHPEPTNTNNTQKEVDVNPVQKDSETKRTFVPFAPKSVARKRTGALLPKSPEPLPLECAEQLEIETETAHDSDTFNNDNELVISSDDEDDVQIMDVINNKTTESDKINETVPNTTENENISLVNTGSQFGTDDVLLIIDSDEEKSKSSNSKSLLKPTSTPIPETPIQTIPVSNVTGTSLSFVRNNANISQKIVVVPSSEDKEHMDAASNASIKAKITNELSYINYIFSKCNYADSCKKTEKKWFLKDIHKFTEKTILPVEVIRSNSEEVKVEYGPDKTEKYASKTAFWNLNNVIDNNKPVIMLKEPPKKGDLNNKYLPCEARTIVSTPTTTNTSVKTTNVASTSNVQLTSNTARIEPTKPNISTTTLISNPNQTTIQTRTVSVESVAKVAANTQNLTVVTAQKQTVCKPTFVTQKQTVANQNFAAPQKQTVGNQNFVAPQKQTVSNPNFVPQKQTVSNPTYVTPQKQIASNTTYVTPQKQMVSNTTQTVSKQNFVTPRKQAISNPTFVTPQNQSVSNPTFVAPQNQASNQTFVTQKQTFVTPQKQTVSNPTFVQKQTISNPTYVTPQSQTVIVSSGTSSNVVPTAVSSNVYAHNNTPIHYRTVNTYGRNYKTISPKPVLPVSPNSTTDKNKKPEKEPESKTQHGAFLVPNGYILMGMPNNENEIAVIQNEDNRSVSNQPIVLNGMPFSSLTNMKNTNSPMVIQPLGQQTNVNIQNCINICQQEVSSNNQQQYTTITVPVLVPGQNELNQVVQLTDPLKSQNQMPPLTQIQSSDANDPNNSRPAIRIKNLAELTDNYKSDQRNDLHNIYSSTLSNYVQTNSSAVTSLSDEYIQIS